ncbi:MAG: DNA-directed RNA polymerase subunit A'', partial [Candidatus Bathyarchaeia archaeon]
EHRRDRSLAEDIANMITHTAVRDVADLIESDIVDMTIRILLDPDAMAKRKVSLEEVKRALTLPHCEVSASGHEVAVKVKGRDIPQFRRLAAHIPDLKVKGLTAVKRALVVEEDGEWIIVTEGSSLKAIMTVPGVDPTRTISNNIHEVAEILGIEAARNVIIKEALEVLEEQGLDVDIRHIMLVADAMTASGEVKQVGRHGISGGKASTLARAAFEITVPTLVDAALKGARDELKGVAENVIVGQQIPMGTGLIEVYMTMPERIGEGEEGE